MSIIFTNHAEERMRQRKMARSDIERVLANPEQTFPGKKKDTTKFVRHINGRRHEVVAKFLKDQNAWLVLSVWVRGEEDSNWINDLFMVVWRVIKFFFHTLRKILFKK